MGTENCLNIPLETLTAEKPVLDDFLNSFSIQGKCETRSFSEIADTVTDDFWESHSITKQDFINLFTDFISGMEQVQLDQKINSLEVIAGFDKSGKPESCNLLLKPGEVTCIVGPTGSGKSRLLADIEWLANADTPTGRKILINNKVADTGLINSYSGKLIAQITQNMNFVLDMDVQSFLMLHAQSRFLSNAEQKVKEVISLANELSGESFSPSTPVTFLSGGQSRALMIADVACIGQAPIVLVDEIENAGVDKRKALELLISQDKIVLVATHDPMLILQAHKRVVIKNGGMYKVIFTNKKERNFYKELELIDRSMQQTRDFFRLGNELTDENDTLIFKKTMISDKIKR